MAATTRTRKNVKKAHARKFAKYEADAGEGHRRPQQG